VRSEIILDLRSTECLTNFVRIGFKLLYIIGNGVRYRICVDFVFDDNESIAKKRHEK